MKNLVFLLVCVFCVSNVWSLDFDAGTIQGIGLIQGKDNQQYICIKHSDVATPYYITWGNDAGHSINVWDDCFIKWDSSDPVKMAGIWSLLQDALQNPSMKLKIMLGYTSGSFHPSENWKWIITMWSIEKDDAIN